VDRKFLEELGLEAKIVDKVLEIVGSEVANIENEFSKFKLNSAVNRSLEASKAKNSKAASALLDMEKIVLSEDGSITGLSEQIEMLKADEATKFLFDSESAVKGALPGEKGLDDTKGLNLDSMSYEQLCEHFSS